MAKYTVYPDGCCAAIKTRTRIASLEMLPDTEPLPHLICSRLIFGYSGVEAGISRFPSF
jgi:hypothetical protein